LTKFTKYGTRTHVPFFIGGFLTCIFYTTLVVFILKTIFKLIYI